MNIRSLPHLLPTQSKTSTTLSVIPHTQKSLFSKRTLHQFQPRVTRRMEKLKSNDQSSVGKCVICLGNYEEDQGKLLCGHSFCLDCIKQWWRAHPSCPFCRVEIVYIITTNGQTICFSDLPPVVKNEDDAAFIPHCEMCWGEIEESEEMNVCTVCRGVYWHRRCLPYRNFKWYCMDCARLEQEEEEQA